METMANEASAHPTAMKATTSVLKPETSIEVGWQLGGRGWEALKIPVLEYTCSAPSSPAMHRYNDA
jgi:hypothetical protein